PMLAPEDFDRPTPWEPETTLTDWIRQRVLALILDADDMATLAEDFGAAASPDVWDPSSRERLRAELDAAMFHLFGVVRDDIDYIMETFPIVRRRDEKEHGEYRTKRLILESYDSMA